MFVSSRLMREMELTRDSVEYRGTTDALTRPTTIHAREAA